MGHARKKREKEERLLGLKKYPDYKKSGNVVENAKYNSDQAAVNSQSQQGALDRKAGKTSSEKNPFSADSGKAIRVYDENDTNTNYSRSIKNDFEIDRERILYSVEFRRLSGKTQVFVAGLDDQMRTRLTHTLEVANIAKVLAKHLDLRKTLSEAIALGHDVGHTPFGHVGERTLNYIMNGCETIFDYNHILGPKDRGFKHNYQGIRVLTELEHSYIGFKGLNLTKYTLWGILNHSSLKYKPCSMKHQQNHYCNLRHQEKRKCSISHHSLDFYNFTDIIDQTTDWTFEALIVSVSDEIAQRHHDIEDGIRAGLLDVKMVIDKFIDIFGISGDKADRIQQLKDEKGSVAIAMLSEIIIDMYLDKYTQIFKSIFKKLGYTRGCFEKSKGDIYLKYTKNHKVSLLSGFLENHEFHERDKRFQDFLATHILNSHLAQSMDGKSDFVIRKLVKAYLTNPQQLPDKTISRIYELCSKDHNIGQWDNMAQSVGEMRRSIDYLHNVKNAYQYRRILLRIICDYIAGMTDRYALEQFEMLYGTKFKWSF